jgi:hypothetical protein
MGGRNQTVGSRFLSHLLEMTDADQATALLVPKVEL